MEKEILRFYGRRHGKSLKPSRVFLMENLLPKIAVSKPTMENFDFETLFDFKPKEVWLEVGFGGGEHLAEQALRHQEIAFIGAEPFMNGVASLLTHINGSHDIPFNEEKPLIEERRVDNIRVWPEDIRQLFPLTKEKSFDRIFVLYPDPWPKSRHENRRFLVKENLKELYRLLKDDGELRVATDVEGYALWAIEEIETSKLFYQTNPDLHRPPEDWVPTRYEQKGLKAGRVPFYLSYRKNLDEKR